MSDIRERCPISCIAHEYAANTCDSDICSKHKAYQQGRTNGIDEIEDIISMIESACISHTENANGEWETLTLDYSLWADVFTKLRELKEQKDEM